jgi:hypothetical protein
MPDIGALHALGNTGFHPLPVGSAAYGWSGSPEEDWIVSFGNHLAT